MTHRQLLERLRAGDTGTFEQIFRDHYARLVTVAERLLADRGRSEDVAQDVLLELWRHRARLDPGLQLSAYLYRSVRNRALNQLRHDRVIREAEPRLDHGPLPPSADAALIEQELDAAIRAAVARLPERCREVFELSRVHHLSYAEIAGVMGITMKTVEAHMGKAIRTLRDLLAVWLREEG
jgi:RNA polymerase sigma-70 factor (ECF subfamily)